LKIILTLRFWIKFYRLVTQKKKWQPDSAVFKAKVAEEVLKEEKTLGQLTTEYGAYSNMLYHWRDQTLAGLPCLFCNQAVQELAQKEVA